MNKKNVFIGLVLILIGVWFYSALSTFETEDDSFPKKLIITEGVARTEEEVAEALANEMGFDLEGAYKTGYTPMEVVGYLINEPHKYSFTFHEGRFYQGRRTVIYIIPVSVCILLIITGTLMVLFNLKSRKT